MVDEYFVTTYGDDECDSCVEEKTKISSKVKSPNSYEYVDVHSERGQKHLESMGIKEGEHVDIPITTVKKCTIEKGEDGQEHKKCSDEKEFKDSYLEKLEKGEDIEF